MPLRRSLSLAGALVVLGFVKYGAGPWPDIVGLAGLAQEWSDSLSLPSEAGYVGYSPLQAIILGTLGLTDLAPYFVGSYVLMVVALCLPVVMPEARANLNTQGLIAIVIAGGALLPTLTSWIGGYDTPFVIAATVAALAQRLWVSLLAWVFVAFQHHQMAIISFVIWAVLLWVHARSQRQPTPRSHIGGAALAIVLGTALIYGLAAQWDLAQSRLGYLEAYGGIAAVAKLYWPLAWLITFSCLGVVWFVLLDARVRSDTLTQVFGVCCLLVAIALPQIVLDHVRVPALVLLLPTLTWIRLLRDRLPDEAQAHIVAKFAPIAVVLPVVLVWEGQVYFPGWTILS